MKPFLTFLLVLAVSVHAEDSGVAGRRVLKERQDAIVTIKLVVHMSMTMGGRDQQNESKTETVGTVIDPSGLTVISLSAIDPSGLMKSRLRGQNAEMKIDSEVKDAKIVLADDTEIPAEVVLRDKDLDVAFLRPIDKPAKPLAAIDLTKAAKPQVLDETIALNRLGKVANRVVAVSLERVDALVERPRPFYVLSPGGSSGIGSPVFALNGLPLGIILLRSATTDGEANAASMFSGSSGALGFMPIVVPAADILEDAKQALEAKKPATEKSP